ncbi:MAG: sulfotransferase, partial [bacterium]
EDIVVDPEKTLGAFCEKIGLKSTASLKMPSWNGRPLTTVHPWGTIRTPTVEANKKTAAELTEAESQEIARRAGPWISQLGYDNFRA